MFALLLVLQTAAAPQKPLPAKDSVALVERVRDRAFRYMMEWRNLWLLDLRHLQLVSGATSGDVTSGTGGQVSDTSGRKPPPHYVPGFDLREPTGVGCVFQSHAARDFDRHEMMAHLIAAPARLKLSLCPIWSPPNWYEPPDERKGIDDALIYPEKVDTARRVRKAVLALLDSAARMLPGDDWVAGQRVRLYVDQKDEAGARRAASQAQCRGRYWWCFALLGYVEFNVGRATQASTAFDQARKVMPDSIRCAWDDVGMFFNDSERREYSALPCDKREAMNARVWWLADPLYLERGNERRTEHYARRVLIELRRGLDADERFDWRDLYQGPALTEMVLRYGWPTHIDAVPPKLPRAWRDGDTRSLFLGDTTITVHFWNNGIVLPPPRIEVVRKGITYWGPQFHTIPLWPTVLDPFHATDAGWDLAPARDGPYWDTSWWPLEFYRRDAGPLVPITSQVAFFRRQNTAIMMSAMGWDTTGFLVRPPPRVVSAALLSKGPDLPFAGPRDTMPSTALRPLVAQVTSGPALLSLEMVSPDGSGAAGRSRFGVTAPQPLRVLSRGELALSEIVLASADSGQDAPPSMVALLPRMLPSTTMRDPKRVAFFWELYGGAPRDTIDVSLRIVRIDESGAARRVAGALGLARVGDDTTVTTWREPRANDPVATADGGTTVRSRGIVLDVTALMEGRYTVDITVRRGAGAPASSRREFWIQR
jgi:hypothetical protein